MTCVRSVSNCSNVKYVIGTKEAVEDELAIAFTDFFYQYLLLGYNIPKSFQQTRIELKNNDFLERKHDGDCECYEVYTLIKDGEIIF